ncbi:MAG: hypothetical protein JWM95_1074 [Gemmatimonadetes bacterium]|nr:hypothetical protein [Gemmatimonadota bacterium]
MRARLLVVAVLFAAFRAPAQAPNATARLGSDARNAVERIVDSARVAGLPTGPLLDKVREGTLKGADDQRIVAAVQSLSRELATARSLLGSASNASLLGATASAVHAGVPIADLRRLLRPPGEESFEADRLTSALVVLVDIVAKRVPPGAAASAIGDMLQRGAPERQFIALRGEVEQDILAGRAPESALIDRTRAHLRTLNGNPLSPRVIPPQAPPYLQ